MTDKGSGEGSDGGLHEDLRCHTWGEDVHEGGPGGAERRKRTGRPAPISAMSWIAGLFLLAHGLIHIAIWCTPFDRAKAPFDPRRSWLAARWGSESSVRGLAVVLAVGAAAAFLIAGTVMILAAPWTPAAAMTGAITSLLLTARYFHPWLSFNPADQRNHHRLRAGVRQKN